MGMKTEELVAKAHNLDFGDEAEALTLAHNLADRLESIARAWRDWHDHDAAEKRWNAYKALKSAITGES